MWSEREQALYWVDILNDTLHRWSASEDRRSWRIEGGVSSVVEDTAGSLLISQRHGFSRFDPRTGRAAPLLHAESGLDGNRFNDGKCDALGRYWAGSMDAAGKRATGSLYRLDPDLCCTTMDSGYPIVNGPAWSPDWRTMYLNDSANSRTYAYDYDLDGGGLSNKRLFLQLGKHEGAPDGMTMDAEGCLWVAQWGASKLTRRDASGRVRMTVELPCSQVSSCTFGGPGLRTLFITTAADGLTAQQREREPLAGGLFALELDIAGMPAQMFAG